MPNVGFKQTVETKAKISRSLLGHHLTEETKAKIRMARLGKPGPWLGKKRSAEACAKISASKKGPLHPNWKGGKKKDSHGYILVKNPTHPLANKSGYVFEHHLIAEKMLGHFLTRGEISHHINGIRDDNRPENLHLFSSKSEHQALHMKLRRMK